MQNLLFSQWRSPAKYFQDLERNEKCACAIWFLFGRIWMLGLSTKDSSGGPWILSRSARCDNPNSAKADYGRIFLLQDIQALQTTDGPKNLEEWCTQPVTGFFVFDHEYTREILLRERIIFRLIEGIGIISRLGVSQFIYLFIAQCRRNLFETNLEEHCAPAVTEISRGQMFRLVLQIDRNVLWFPS
jgi:hypothetical protein